VVPSKPQHQGRSARSGPLRTLTFTPAPWLTTPTLGWEITTDAGTLTMSQMELGATPLTLRAGGSTVGYPSVLPRSKKSRWIGNQHFESFNRSCSVLIIFV